MIDTIKGRIFAIILLLAGQTILFPLYAQQPVNTDAGVYPSADEFIQTSNEFVGEPVVTGGFVLKTDPLIIKVETTRGMYKVKITQDDLSPAKGDKVRVYGRLIAPNTIASIHSFVVPQGGLLYTWGISLFAGLWVLFRLIRHWTVDLSNLGFYHRKTPLSIWGVIYTIFPQRGDEDA